MIETGFEKVGNVIPSSLVDRYLRVAICKIINLEKSISILCEQGYTDESMIILRSFIEHSINISWIMQKDSLQRVRTYILKDDLSKGFGQYWTEKKLINRMKDIGFESRDYYDFCVKPTYSYAHVNSSSLKWNKVFDDPRLDSKPFSPEAIYQVEAQMLGHVLKALNTQFNGYFDKYEEIWKCIKVDKNVRKKFIKICKEFEKSA